MIKSKITKTFLSWKFWFLLALVVLGGQVLLAAKSALAQGVFDLSVTPPIAYLRVRPGTSTSHVITVENTGSAAVTIKPYFVDFIPRDGSALPQESLSFPYLETPADGFNTLTLEPKQKSQLSIKISPPADAVEKEYYLTILFQTENPSAETVGSPVVGAVGSNLIVLVAQKEQLSALSIESFGVSGLIDSFRSIQIKPVATNNSIQAAVASGSASLKNWRGKTVYQAEIFPDVVLGKNSRTLRASQITFNSETGQAEREPASFEHSQHILLGTYKLEITLTDSQAGDQTYSKTVLALPLSVVMVSILTAISAIFWYLIKNTSRNSHLQK